MELLIEGALTEKKLGEALKSLFNKAESQVKLSQVRRFRWDFLVELGNRKIVVEYDGNDHYQDSLKIRDDEEKDEIARSKGFEVIRIPYFVQLTTKMVKHYFDVDCVINQDFPHGFITTKIFPASFCELGIQRFIRELDSLPDAVRKSIIGSLRDRIAEHGARFVLPSSLTYLLESP